MVSDGRWFDRDARERLLEQATERSLPRSEQHILRALEVQGTDLEYLNNE